MQTYSFWTFSITSVKVRCIPTVLPWASSLQWPLTARALKHKTIYQHCQWHSPADKLSQPSSPMNAWILRELIPRPFPGLCCALPTEPHRINKEECPWKGEGLGIESKWKDKNRTCSVQKWRKPQIYMGWRLSKTILAMRFLLQDNTIFTSRPSKWASTRHLTSLKPPFLSFYCYPSFSCRLPSRHYLYLNFLVIHFQPATTISISYHVRS